VDLPPSKATWILQGSNGWCPDLERIRQVRVAKSHAPKNSTVGWLTLSTGKWTTRSVAGGSASCLGWRGRDLIVQSGRADGTADVYAISPDGATRIRRSYGRDGAIIYAPVAMDHA
jgi:hypothetical protein